MFEKPFDVVVDADLQDLIPPYLVRRREESEQLKQLLSEGRHDEIKEIVHKLSGNAGGYGFTDLGEIAADIESECMKNEVDNKKLSDLMNALANYALNVRVTYE